MLMIHVCVAYSCQGLVSSLSWTCYVLSTSFHCHVGSKPFVCFSVSHILLTILPGELICSLKESKSFSVSTIPSARTLMQLIAHHQRSVPPALSPYINHGLPYPIFAHRNKVFHSLNTSERGSHWCLKHHISNLKMKREKF